MHCFARKHVRLLKPLLTRDGPMRSGNFTRTKPSILSGIISATIMSEMQVCALIISCLVRSLISALLLPALTGLYEVGKKQAIMLRYGLNLLINFTEHCFRILADYSLACVLQFSIPKSIHAGRSDNRDIERSRSIF